MGTAKQSGRAVNALMTANVLADRGADFEQQQRGGERVDYGEQIVEEPVRDLGKIWPQVFSCQRISNAPVLPCLPSFGPDTVWTFSRLTDAVVSSLERDPLLAERLKRLRTIPGVGPITALTWALEIGDVSRFQSVKQAISYCGLCSAERSSANRLVRMPISKQRNKHIQQTLVEAAKLAPRYSHELTLVYERERQRGNKNRATLAVARKMVAYMLAVERRKQNFVLTGEFSGTAAV
jgi:hypothetical protein